MLKFVLLKKRAKDTHIFSYKNIRILYIESTKTVNEMTLNEPVKLTMLWTTQWAQEVIKIVFLVQICGKTYPVYPISSSGIPVEKKA